jgi:hypothetical protein
MNKHMYRHSIIHNKNEHLLMFSVATCITMHGIKDNQSCTSECRWGFQMPAGENFENHTDFA